MKELLEKLKYSIVDVFNKSENKFDDMILIFEYVYRKYVFYVGEDVVEKIVFGRDVLINECVYFS